ncbi:TonB-dependent receptor [Flavivirga sp. 57AJ16]|uniref:SusC/RagA family TonB-linked outer membrane protein n=1 Tax=Flavivirga sp. 57AJ16 TaxID=3025307 RepID=UPI002365E1B7|nr:TonB-dependent receptor [Flavivirga sp. 57AJ16]MDD7885489.1 TonB-dependent receptor [Flavivirga sp. 57AJ16]
MRAFIFLLCITVFSFTSNNVLSQNSKVTIDSDKTLSVDEVFKIISAQTDYKFIYLSDLFKNFPKVNLKKGTIKTQRLLEKTLAVGNFKFNLTNKNSIVIREKNKNINRVQQTVSGKVTDENGVPLAGVNVLINTDERGTSTDIEGNYSIKINAGDKVSFNYLGYATQELIYSNQAEINVVLKESTSTLDEVVLVGYGSKKKSEITSAISSIKADKVVLPVGTSIDGFLGGKLAGVSVTQSSGQPGSLSIVNIRGVTSFRGANQPLYVIDGIPFLVEDNLPVNFNNGLGGVARTNPLEMIVPSDVENIDVLKDAAATAIYGSRAANGVILITTKKGKRNQKPVVTFNSSLSFSTPVNKFDLLDANEYRDVLVEAARATYRISPNNPAALPIVDPTTGDVIDSFFGDSNVDWQDEISRNAAQTKNISVNISGGGNSSNYSFSINRVDQEAIFVGEDYINHAIRGNYDANIWDNLKVGGGLSYQSSKANTGSISTMDGVFSTRPDLPVRDDNGELFFINDDPSYNLLANQDLVKGNNNGQNFSANAYGQLSLFKYFTLKSTISATVNNSEVKSFYGINNVNQRTDNNSFTTNSTWENTLAFDRSFNNHQINAMLGNTFDFRRIEVDGLTYNGLPSAAFSDVAGLSESTSRVFEHFTESRLQSYFARINYNFDKKYYVSFTGRTDGYSKFGPDNRWAYFPAAAASWRISNESFMENVSFVDDLKVRFSIGTTGRANLPDFSNIRYYSPSITGSPTQYGDFPAIALSPIADETVGWETTNELNIGLDFTLFNNWLSGTVNYFNRTTTDMLLFNPTFPSSGYSDIYGNSDSEVLNKGFEISLNGTIIKTKDIEWNSAFNISFVENTIEKMNGSIFSGFDFRLEEGASMGSIVGYIADGIFKTQEEIDNHATQGNPSIGDLKYRDITDDGVINLDDRTVIGDHIPDYYGGWNNVVKIKDFELGFDFQFSYGLEKEWSAGSAVSQGSYGGRNLTKQQVENAWSPGKGDTMFPELRLASSGNLTGLTTATLQDASFIRLRNISLKYNVPTNFLEKFKITRASIFINATNMFTWTDYMGIDPESANSSNITVETYNSNRDFGGYPLAKTTSLGLSVSF